MEVPMLTPSSWLSKQALLSDGENFEITMRSRFLTALLPLVEEKYVSQHQRCPRARLTKTAGAMNEPLPPQV
jgi:hypothetical protein